jgi:heme/copper-type cytochrome/quinol oxidase subunit 2
MWILVSLGMLSLLLIGSSIELALFRSRDEVGSEKLVEFIKSILVQLVISILVLFASGYLMITLEEANTIRDNTSNTPEFFRAVFKGLGCVAGLGFIFYVYIKMRAEVKGED